MTLIPYWTLVLPDSTRVPYDERAMKRRVQVSSHTRKLRSGALVRVQQHTRGSEDAPGLPNRKVTTDLPEFTGTRVWHYAVQEHMANRAGKHYDLRLGDPRSMVAHSWAVPKARFPEPGKPLLAVRQPDHTIPYMDFTGVISSGYGAGHVKKVDRGPVHVTSSAKDSVRFEHSDGRRFLLRRVGEKLWLFINVPKGEGK